MYFDVNGDVDVASMLSSEKGGIDREKFCGQILEKRLTIDGYQMNSQVEEWRQYYTDMHPKAILLEALLKKECTKEEIEREFSKFIKPLMAADCTVTIIDPYLFAKNLDIDLFCNILADNIASKSVRIITNEKNRYSNACTQKNIEQRLKDLGFKLIIKHDDQSHDRYWYSRVNGFSIGTSMNGISKKLTTLLSLPQEDLNEIIKMYGLED